MTCKGKVNDEQVMNLIVEPSVNDADVTSYSTFWFFFMALAISWVGMAVVVSVGDAICFDLLGKRHEFYGHQRLWGAVGFGIFSFLAGFWVDANSGQQAYKSYTVIYYIMAAALLPNATVSTCLEVSSALLLWKHFSEMFNANSRLFSVQTKQILIEYYQRYRATLQIGQSCGVLFVVHRSRPVHCIGMEFLVLASRRFGRPEGRVSYRFAFSLEFVKILHSD